MACPAGDLLALAPLGLPSILLGGPLASPVGLTVTLQAQPLKVQSLAQMMAAGLERAAQVTRWQKFKGFLKELKFTP